MLTAMKKIYRGENNYDFVAGGSRVLMAAGAIVLVSVIALFTRGLDLGIEFDGGAVWEVPATGQLSEDDMRAVMTSEGLADARVQRVSGGDDTFRVRAELDDTARRDEVAAALADRAGVDVVDVSTRTVSPSFGDAVAGKARRALVVFFIIIAIYLTLRFEWRMAAGALVAVAHDIVASVGMYSLLGIEVTPSTVVAFLTIMGYSLYDTIVVFDRLRVNTRALSTKSRVTYPDLANVSMNQMLVRSINTSLTSVLPVLSLLIVGSLMLGASSLEEFAIALLVGIVFGSASSLFVAMPIVVWLKGREHHWQERLDGAKTAGASESLSGARQSVAAEHYGRSQTPRPRKQGKRR
ncbi:MAG: preprotein translocase subunit SecF [Candidatus Poriferisodalaceae bacterium]|jgi:preprotein translocase subunit SecF